jgi:ABC-type transport system involved in multi-copper enzyme maturation permease subunit
MQRLLAIAWLTWKAAFRFRLFLVIAVLLLASVVGLPMVIKDDGTARGFTQILLTYTLSVITGLLGLSTLWLACGTLARDIEECQMQVVATKPIARWQIWLGKWLGIMSLNAALLALSGACVYGLLQWRATKLPVAEQKILREQVLVARGSAKEPSNEAAIEAETERILQARLKSNPVDKVDLSEVRTQIREQVKADFQLVPPGYSRPWQIDLGFARNFLRDKPLQLRVKFNSAQKSPSGTFVALWQVGDPNSANLWRSEPMSLAPDTFHEFQIPANLFDDKGVLTVWFINPNDTALLFPLADGMEVLYPEGGFTLNFVRGLGIIFCWMALLAALGLTAASFLTFPVAAFFSLAVLTIGLSSSTLAETVESGTVMGGNGETGAMGHSVVDAVLIPLFKGCLTVIKLVENFSPIDALSSGRSISWSELGRAFGQIVLLPGGIIGVIGILLFNRRELATAQGNQ